MKTRQSKGVPTGAQQVSSLLEIIEFSLPTSSANGTALKHSLAVHLATVAHWRGRDPDKIGKAASIPDAGPEWKGSDTHDRSEGGQHDRSIG